MGIEPSAEAEFLRRLRGELGRVYHDLSNPLAIVSGNLELVHELKAAGVPPEEFMDSIQDAHTAVAGFTSPLQHLMDVRTLIDDRLQAVREEDPG